MKTAGDMVQSKEALLGEYQAKRERLKAAMAERGLDAVELRRTDTIAWLTAGQVDRRVLLPSSLSTAVVVVLRSGEAFSIAPDNEAQRLAEEDYRDLGMTPVTMPWHAADAAAEVRRLAGGAAVLADTAAEAAPFFRGLRASLMDTEIERYRWLGAQMAQATTDVLHTLAPGVTERTMAARISAALIERGIEPSVLLMAVDERIRRYKHAVAQNARLERFGMLNLCGRRWGLAVSITRFVHFGAMPDDLVDGFATAAETNAALVAATREGAISADLFGIAADTYRRCCHPSEELRHHQGGATGYAEREWTAKPGGTERVVNRQAFAWNPSAAGGKVEDTVLLRDGVIELLTRTPELPVVETRAGGVAVESAGVLVQ